MKSALKVDRLVDQLDTWSLACHALNHNWEFFGDEPTDVAKNGTINIIKVVWHCPRCDGFRTDTIKLSPRYARVVKRSYNRSKDYSPQLKGRKKPTKDMYRAAYLARELKDVIGV